MSRAEVLRCYRTLLRTRATVFAGDRDALRVTHAKAREAFEKNRNIQEKQKVEKALQVGWDAIEILKRTVIQAKLNTKGNYEVEIKKDHLDG